MSSSKTKIKTVSNKYPTLGLIFWILCIQYFLVQLIVGLAWVSPPYSWRLNTISDLGNTMFGLYGGRYVCSPLYDLMNESFVLLGICMIYGSILIFRGQDKNRALLWGVILMGRAGLGSILLGLFPENSVRSFHVTGAALTFILGNVALIIFGLTLSMPKAFRFFTITLGFAALVALGLFFTHNYLGLGIGGMERLTAYPQTVWLILFGIYSFKALRKIS